MAAPSPKKIKNLRLSGSGTGNNNDDEDIPSTDSASSNAPVPDTLKGSLLEILQDPVYSPQFAQYLRQERCEENYLFWQQVRKKSLFLLSLEMEVRLYRVSITINNRPSTNKQSLDFTVPNRMFLKKKKKKDDSVELFEAY
jgi:hypothetical protein